MCALLSPFHLLGSVHLLPHQTPTDPHPCQRTPLEGPVFEDLPDRAHLCPFQYRVLVPMPASQKLRNTPVLQQATLLTEVVQLAEVEVQTTTVPRTTAWRQRKRTAAVATLPQTQARRRYTCRICGEPMASTGHSQFYGKRYCPNSPEQVYQKKSGWLKEKWEEQLIFSILEPKLLFSVLFLNQFTFTCVKCEFPSSICTLTTFFPPPSLPSFPLFLSPFPPLMEKIAPQLLFLYSL